MLPVQTLLAVILNLDFGVLSFLKKAAKDIHFEISCLNLHFLSFVPYHKKEKKLD